VLDEIELFEELERRGRLPRQATAVALGIGDNAGRIAVFSRIEPRHMPPLIHPSAVVAESASVAPASVVLACAVVNANARLGQATIINSGAVVEHDCEIGDAVHVAPGAVLTGGAQVSSGAWIGAGATVLPGISIGRDTVVGAGAVVTTDLPPACTAVGVPAKVIGGDERSVHRSRG
jgi:sugar O-acyltransferase (sialic acid O-acetyltransferase NeuD family)